MRDYVIEIKNIFFDVMGDFRSSISHANDLLVYSSTKSIVIFFLAVLFVFFYIIFNSNSQAGFYINFLRILFVGFATYFIYCFSNYFWFLIKRKNFYKICISHKKHINFLLEVVRKDKTPVEEVSFEEIILYTAKLISTEYRYHVKRYAIESFLIIFILAYVDPNFFVFNILLFGGMYIYVFLYEKQATDQAFDSLHTLIYFTDRFNKENPKKCKKFIMGSKLEEIRELKKLYQIVLKTP